MINTDTTKQRQKELKTPCLTRRSWSGNTWLLVSYNPTPKVPSRCSETSSQHWDDWMDHSEGLLTPPLFGMVMVYKISRHSKALSVSPDNVFKKCVYNQALMTLNQITNPHLGARGQHLFRHSTHHFWVFFFSYFRILRTTHTETGILNFSMGDKGEKTGRGS